MASMDAPEPQLLAPVGDFLAQETNFQQRQHQLCKLSLDPSSSSRATPNPIIPMEELDTRLRIIEELRRHMDEQFTKGFDFTILQLSVFLVLPMGALQHLQQKNQQSNAMGTLFVLEREKCLSRDQNSCIFTKSVQAEACHILPPAITANQENIGYFQMFCSYTMAFLGDSLQQLTRLLCFNDCVGSMDKHWNMLCLHPTLHSWWSKGLFGIKCLGVIPGKERCTVQLQFHWMPRNGLDPDQKVTPPYHDTVSKMLQSVGREVDGINSFHGLETGQIFEILMDREEAANMKMALDLKWTVTRLAAISNYDWRGFGLILNESGDVDEEQDDEMEREMDDRDDEQEQIEVRWMDTLAIDLK
ncbi:hypothetical protein V8C42DRAFT_346671 [Trichoderma barbatum]